MKILHSPVYVLVMAVILSSCNSTLTVTKRHFNKGYHVSYNRINKSVQESTEEEQLAKTDLIRSEETTIAVVETVPRNELNLIEPSDQLSSDQNNLIVASGLNEKVSTDNSIQSKESAQTKPVKEFKKANLQTMKKNIKNTVPASDRELSLFWLVILIILILWAVGFGFGYLGGLVHLLLLVALILLILWLLGII